VSDRFLEVAGERIHVVQRGSGPPVLLIHGFPSNAIAFAALMPLLDDRFALTAVDMVGFGQSTRAIRRPLDGDSYADRLVDLLDALELERPHVVGLSWGGSVAQRLAARHPQRVERLVLLAAVSAARVLRLSDANLIGLALAIRFPALGRAAVRRFVARSSGDADVASEALVRGYVDPLRVPGTLGVLRRFVRDTAATPPIDLAAIGAPTLVVVPQADRIVPPAAGAEIAAGISGARHVGLPGVGHALQFQARDEVAALIREFLA
jgi:2-hydroxy-6-oxo-octa-2,4-dienoate hydrolase